MKLYNDPVGWLRSAVGSRARLSSCILIDIIIGLIIFQSLSKNASEDSHALAQFLVTVCVFGPICFAYASYRTLQELDKLSPPPVIMKDEPITIIGLVLVAVILLLIIFIEKF